jgi:hypothetical protein
MGQGFENNRNNLEEDGRSIEWQTIRKVYHSSPTTVML